MMGILSGHVPTLEALKPGVLEVIESGNNSKKWFSEFLLFSSLFAWVGLWKKGSERGGKEGRLDCDAWLEMPCWIALAPWPPCMPALVNCPDQRVLCVPQSLPDSLPSTPTTPSPSTPLRLTISPSSTLPFVPSHTLLSAFPPFCLLSPERSDYQAVKNSLATAKSTLSSASSELAKAEAQIEVDVLTVLEAAVKA